MTDIIRALLDEFRAAGIAAPHDVKEQIEINIREKFGGTDVRVNKLPKLQHNRIERIARQQKLTQVTIATRTGLSVRQVRRIQRGK